MMRVSGCEKPTPRARTRGSLLTLVCWAAIGSLGEAAPAVPGPEPVIVTNPGTPPGARTQGVRSDTTWYGSYTVYQDEYFAVPGPVKEGVMWTFDRGIGPQGDPSRIENGEGWAAVNPTQDEQAFFRVIDEALDLGPDVEAPLLSGAQSLWIGAQVLEAYDYRYDCEAGYANGWDQRAISEPLPYDGSGAIQLSFLYYQDSEAGYDGTQVYLVREDGSRLLLNPSGGDLGFTGRIGIDAQGIITPALFERSVTPAEIGGAQQVRFLVEFTSDGGWSDEDCGYATPKGPFAIDDISVEGGGIDRIYTFETGDQGWVAMNEETLPTEAGIADGACYSVPSCLSVNVLEVHAGECDEGYHPAGQSVLLESPVCLVGPGWDEIFFEHDMYEDTAFLYRVGWKYYPDPGPMGNRWSERVGQDSYHHFGAMGCLDDLRSYATPFVPASAEKVVAVLELLWLAEEPVPSPTPLFDDLVVGRVGGLAPADVVDGAVPGGSDLRLRSWPSPVRSEARLSFRLSQPQDVRLEVFDPGGRLLRTLLGGSRAAGDHAIAWDASDAAGRRLSPGVYWIRIVAGNRQESRKVLVLR
jgi:hypothetical protein